MCGRFAQAGSGDGLAELLGLDEAEEAELPPRYNLAPGQLGAVVRRQDRRPRLLRWGFGAGRLINARAETLASRPAFRDAYRFRRCLVPVTGFYEWERRPGGKQPWLVRRSGSGWFALAGLWEAGSFTIVTTAPVALVARIHDRMPVILPAERFGDWLAGEEVGLAPFAPGDILAHPVSALVNDPANDDPRCVTPSAPAPKLFPTAPAAARAPRRRAGGRPREDPRRPGHSP